MNYQWGKDIKKIRTPTKERTVFKFLLFVGN